MYFRTQFVKKTKRQIFRILSYYQLENIYPGKLFWRKASMQCMYLFIRKTRRQVFEYLIFVNCKGSYIIGLSTIFENEVTFYQLENIYLSILFWSKKLPCNVGIICTMIKWLDRKSTYSSKLFLEQISMQYRYQL